MRHNKYLDEKVVIFRGDPYRRGAYDAKGVYKLNRLRWKFNTGGAVDSSPTVAYETVYIGSNCGRFYALDTRAGGIKWTFELKKYYLPTSAIVAEGVVYFNSDGGLRGGITHAVDAATGQEIWRFDRAGAYSSPAFDDGIVYIGSNRTIETQSYIESYGLDAKNGKVIWKFERKSEIVQGLLADTFHIIAHGVVYFGSYDGYLYAVDIRTATEKWRFEKIIREGCVPAIVQDVAYIQTEDSNLYCIDIETGVSKSSFKIKGKFTGSIAVYRGVIYFGAGTKFFYAVDMKELHEKWKFKAEKMVGSPPSIAEGIIYFGSYDGYLYAVDIATGQEKWKYKTGKVVRCSPSIADGVVYFGSNDGYLYALS